MASSKGGRRGGNAGTALTGESHATIPIAIIQTKSGNPPLSRLSQTDNTRYFTVVNAHAYPCCHAKRIKMPIAGMNRTN
jgi:hypothetical protein